MSGQALDLKRSAQIVRRYKVLVGTLAALGLLVGIAYAFLRPPMLTSQTLIVLPNSANSSTQAVIAGSDPILTGAIPGAGHGMTLGTLRSRVQVQRVTSNVISVSGQGKSAADAEDIANSVASSYVDYVNSAKSPVGQVQARVLEPAATAVGTSLVSRLLDTGLAGLVGGLLIGVIIALALGRHDRRLRDRDAIADSIGVPVLASIPVVHPSDAAGWAKLVEEYEPGPVDAWRLRKALHQLGLAGLNPADAMAGAGASLAVLSLSSDRNALALGPQVAAVAASLGIPTALVVGPQQDANVTATLHAACTDPAPRRRGNLRTSVSDHDVADQQTGAALTIVVTVVDGQTPRVADTMHATVTVLGVSAGAATAEQLARIAASAAVDGRDIAGILVADPDSADQTTGRLPQLARPGRRRTPTRMTSTATEIRR